MKKSIVVFLLLLVHAANAQENAAPTMDAAQAKFLAAIDAHRDLPYAGTDHPRQQLDLFLPKGRAGDKPLPVVVFVHGGGWRGGTRQRAASAILPLVANGDYAGASVDYRFSSEVVWPAQIHDCKAALRWIRGHAQKYNLDPDRIAVWGSSAGGHLVSLLGTTAGNQELDGALGSFTDLSTRVSCVVNQCGPCDLTVPLRPKAAPDAVDEAVAGLLGGPPREKAAEAKAASPLTHVSADAASFFIFHGTADERVDFGQSLKLDAGLRRAGASSLLIEVTGGGHGITFTPELRSRVTQFLDLHLRGIASEIAATPVVAAPRFAAPPAPK